MTIFTFLNSIYLKDTSTNFLHKYGSWLLVFILNCLLEGFYLKLFSNQEPFFHLKSEIVIIFIFNQHRFWNQTALNSLCLLKSNSLEFPLWIRNFGSKTLCFHFPNSLMMLISTVVGCYDKTGNVQESWSTMLGM